MEIIIIF